MYSLDQTHTIDIKKKIQQTKFKLSPKSARKISLPVLHCAEHTLSPTTSLGIPGGKSVPPSLRKFPCLSNLALPPKRNNNNHNHKNKK